MRKELLIAMILSLAVSAAHSEVKISHDEFTGETGCSIESILSTEDVFGAGLRFMQIHKDGSGYGSPSALFWSMDHSRRMGGEASRFKGDAHFLVDGERYQFSLQDSSTNIGTGNSYVDRGIYAIDREMYDRLASANEVRVRLNGQRSVVVDFGKEALDAAAVFKSECLDGFM